MIMRLYSIKDELVGFGKPVVMENNDVAIRQFSDLVNVSPEYRDHAKDYSLYFVGEFFPDLGVFGRPYVGDGVDAVPADSPIKIVDALSVLKAID